MTQHCFIMVTFPAQGHINPSLQFAKRLARTGADVTFVTSLSAHLRIGNSTSTPNGLTFAPFSDGYDQGYKFGDDHKHFISELERRGRQAITDLVVSGASEGRPYTCILCSIFLTWVGELARELHLPTVLVWIQPATVFDIYYYYFNGYKDEINSNTAADSDPAYAVELPGLLLALKSRDLPSFIVATNPHIRDLPLIEKQFVKLEEESRLIILLVYKTY